MLTPAHIEKYLKICANPGWNHLHPETALIFQEGVENALRRLDELDRNVLFWQAQGFTQAEIAEMIGVSIRTVSRKNASIRCRAFAELQSWIDFRIKVPRCASTGKRLGRPKKIR